MGWFSEGKGRGEGFSLVEEGEREIFFFLKFFL